MSSTNDNPRPQRERISMKFQKRTFTYEHPVTKPSPEKHRAAIALIESRMEKARDARDKSHETSKALRQQAIDAFKSDTAKSEFDVLVKESKALRQKIDDVTSRLDDAHKTIAEQSEVVAELVREFGSRSAESIDSEVADIEADIAHTSMSREEEHTAIEKINKLKAMKTRLQDRVDAQNARQATRDEIAALKEERSALITARKELDARFEETSARFQPAKDKRESLFERANSEDARGDDLHARFIAAQKERRAAWDDWKKQNDEWYEEYKAAREAAYQRYRESENARWEEWMARADERKRVFRARQMADAQKPPFTEKLGVCERALEILEEMIGATHKKSENAAAAKATVVPTDKIAAIRESGRQIAPSKKDALVHAAAAASGGSKKRRRRQARVQAKPVVAADANEFDIISLSELLDLLTELEIELVPKTIADCQTIRGKVRGMIKNYGERTDKIIAKNVEALKARWEAEDARDAARKAGKKVETEEKKEETPVAEEKVEEVPEAVEA